MVTRRAINSITFVGFIEESLCPNLKPVPIVVMDNLPVHKVKGMEEALPRVGAEAWRASVVLARLQPDRAGFSKVKNWLRNESTPTFGRLIGAIGRALTNINRFAPRIYFANAGYAFTPTSNPL